MTPGVAEMPAASGDLGAFSDSRQLLEADVLRTLAGPIAERRATEGGGGFRRWISWDQSRAFHESGHICIAAAVGFHPWHVSIKLDQNVKIGAGFMGGVASAGITREPVADLPPGTELETDRRSVARTCLVLAMREEVHGWRGAVRAMNRLRSQARGLVEKHWVAITILAIALEQHGELDRCAIERILRPREI